MDEGYMDFYLINGLSSFLTEITVQQKQVQWIIDCLHKGQKHGMRMFWLRTAEAVTWQRDSAAIHSVVFIALPFCSGERTTKT